MLEFLVFFGTGAITYLISEKCSGKEVKYGYQALIEWFAYSAIDVFVSLMVLIPVDKAAIIFEEGRLSVKFFLVGYAASMLIAVVIGVVAAVAKKKLQIKIEIES